MPNWCDNILIVTGDEDDLATFVRSAQSPVDNTDLSLGMLCPMPESVPKGNPIAMANGASIPTMSDDEWHWCVDNWGTKWDVEAQFLYRGEDRVEYIFTSAWSPPVQAFDKIAKDYPSLDFTLKYAESGMGFAGCTHFSKGELVYDDCEGFADYNDWVRAAQSLDLPAMFEWELYGYDCEEDYVEAVENDEV